MKEVAQGLGLIVIAIALAAAATWIRYQVNVTLYPGLKGPATEAKP